VTWRLSVEHQTEYVYEGTVLASYNEVRVTPRAGSGQVVLDHDVGIRPASRVLRYVDYWGTKVTAFDVHQPHDRLVVNGRSLVETGPRGRFDDDGSWDDLRCQRTRDEFYEFLGASAYVPEDRVFDAVAREVTAGRTPAEAIEAIAQWTRTHMTYERGPTTVKTTASEAIALGRGVCQDFVHVAIALLRAAGIPARYASGYLHPHEAASIDETVIAESHAWLDAWIGDWCPIDPTNGAPVAERHVLVAQGRDYADVTPLKGVYHGRASEAVDVRVAITRVA
jgi:transglutaminase-like putative cysteine protease